MKAKPSVVKDWCARSITPKSTCTVCMDLCPASSIKLKSNLPEIDPNTCTLCLICTTHCPLGAITLPFEKGKILLEAEKALRGKGKAALSCSMVESTCDLRLPCLGVLSKDTISFIASLKVDTLTLIHGICENCPVGSLEPLKEAIDKVKGIKIQMERRPLSTLPTETLVDKLAYESSLVRRRELLESLKGKIKRKSVEEPTYLPFARDELVKSGFTSKIFLPRPNIDDSCNGCSGAEPLCVKLCPSGALTKLEKEEELLIEVKPDLCSGCGICRDVCPESAICLDTTPSPEKAELKRFKTVKCRICGRKIPSGHGDVCPACRNRENLQARLKKFVEEAF